MSALPAPLAVWSPSQVPPCPLAASSPPAAAALQRLPPPTRPAPPTTAAGGHALLAAAGARLAHSAPASGAVIRSREDEGRHPGAPASLPEVPPRRRPADGAGAQPDLSLASINDPEQWGLSSSPAQQARGEGYGHYWLGSSLRCGAGICTRVCLL